MALFRDGNMQLVFGECASVSGAWPGIVIRKKWVWRPGFRLRAPSPGPNVPLGSIGQSATGPISCLMGYIRDAWSIFHQPKASGPPSRNFVCFPAMAYNHQSALVRLWRQITTSGRTRYFTEMDRQDIFGLQVSQNSFKYEHLRGDSSLVHVPAFLLWTGGINSSPSGMPLIIRLLDWPSGGWRRMYLVDL